MIDSASEQPASRSGISTVLSGHRIEAVSAMKWTPQKAITSDAGRGGLAREPERVADEVGDVLDLGQLVVVGEDDGVAARPPARVPRPAGPARPRARRAAAAGGWSVGRALEASSWHGSDVMERSRAGAEWVSEPIDTKFTPVSRVFLQILE